MSPHYVVHLLVHYIKMAYSQTKHVAVWTVLIYKIVVLKWKLFVIFKPPFCLQGMRSDKFYFIIPCWDLSQTDVGNVELVLSSSSVAANNWIFQIFVEEKSYWMKLLPLHLSIKLDCSVHIINLNITGDISTVFQSQFISCQQMWLKTLRIKCWYWCRNCW